MKTAQFCIPPSAFYIEYMPYIRDKRSPTPKSEAVSRVMSANRAKNSRPELLLRQALWHSGLRGYRLHYKIKLAKSSPPYQGGVAAVAADGVVLCRSPHVSKGVKLNVEFTELNSSPVVRPDISFVGKKLAIFVHGCFWHRCPKCNYTLPTHNTEFWQAKFDRNVARDRRKRSDLKRLGWKVITVWECDLKTRLNRTLE